MTTDQTPSGWFKSSYSGGNNNNCLEARFTGVGIDIRDSKDPYSPILRFDTAGWSRFLNRLASADEGSRPME